jgi:hypothetical protein
MLLEEFFNILDWEFFNCGSTWVRAISGMEQTSLEHSSTGSQLVIDAVLNMCLWTKKLTKEKSSFFQPTPFKLYSNISFFFCFSGVLIAHLS